MKTITIQIGNSDDKLSQIVWSDYVNDIAIMFQECGIQIHFFGGSVNWEWWQNAAWVIEVSEHELPNLRERLSMIRERYSQDSLAWTEGETEFI